MDIRGDSFGSMTIVDTYEVSTREGIMDGGSCLKMAAEHGLSLLWLTKRVDIKGDRPLVLDQWRLCQTHKVLTRVSIMEGSCFKMAA